MGAWKLRVLEPSEKGEWTTESAERSVDKGDQNDRMGDGSQTGWVGESGGGLSCGSWEVGKRLQEQRGV